uniref:TSA: Wollemia nobilis Ref_Wollemi_Transcript_4754_1939 transcribed RNA sequence n=1 Tax=Wollemia nobilis TaxID=56998 RepID=A0A0C9RPS4_9CONI
MKSFGSFRGGSNRSSSNGIATTFEGVPELKECGYYDVQQIQPIVQQLLVTLAAACVEKASADPFKRPGSFVEDLKAEMLEYLHQQIESYASGSGSMNGSGRFQTPVKVVGDAVQGFLRSKRSLFRRVSSKILSGDVNDGRIEEFVQELERTGLWIAGKREAVAKSLLKRADRSRMYHCDMRFEKSQELAEHKAKCPLRPIMCTNEGCAEVLSAIHFEEHDGTCPFKLLSCQQGCGATLSRKDMEGHCSTMCPNKVVPCPFNRVGCVVVLPQGSLEQHYSDFMAPHLLYVLQSLHKQESTVVNQAQRIHLLEKAMSIAQRSEAVDVGSISLTVKEQEARIKSLEQEVTKLRQDLKATDVSAEVLQLRREIRNLHKQVENLNLGS